MSATFEQVVDSVMELSAEQQEMLMDLIKRRYIERRRREIAQNAQESLQAFRDGRLRAQSARDVIRELQQALDDEE